MENTINFGIDLGTTNSAITKFIKGEVVVYNNPLDFGRATLPSVVCYQKDKITVGSKAKEMFGKQKKDTSSFAFFKRKMGTSESFPIKFLNKSITPIELSAQVLKELKTFVIGNEKIDATVITVPASFDLIQSNATKEAGYQAGFKQVILLQEPIAASLAYANMRKSNELTDGQWLVYDFGGGTFDVALIRIKDGEMKVIDHEGDNFLGGADFDQLIVEKLIVPKIEDKYSFSNLIEEMKSADGKYLSKYYVLMSRAEEAKVRLSAITSAEVVVDGFQDEKAHDVDFEVVITRSEFNELIKPSVDRTIEMIKTILTRNTLGPKDLQFILMVGGTTYVPFVRQRVEEILQIPANCEIDPTTAVAIGAAYYAATKPKNIDDGIVKEDYAITIKDSYKKASKEKEELYAAKITGKTEGLFYKIVRQDGGYDSGLIKLTQRISEDLPLVENTYNFFTLTIYDKENNVIKTNVEPIGINSGFGISGQPLPEDICLEVDDYDNPGDTKLALVFQRGTILPTKRTLQLTLNKNIQKGSNEDVIRVNVLQGSHLTLPEANKKIGIVNITGKNLKRDVARGSDIEITISLSESQDLTVAAYLNMADQEFKDTFNPKERHTDVDSLKIEVDELTEKLDDEIDQATEKEDYETANTLSKLKYEMENINDETSNLSTNDVTDKKYQIEDKKRKIAQEIDNATKHKRLQRAKEIYFETKDKCKSIVEEGGNDYERKLYNDIVSQEETFLATNSPIKLQEKADDLHNIISTINWRTPEFLAEMYKWLKADFSKMNDQSQAKSLIDAGKVALDNQNWDRMREIIFGLLDLMPKGTRDKINNKIGFGL